MHPHLKQDIAKGLFTYEELEYKLVGDNERDCVDLALYNTESYLSTYSYPDRESAEEDMEEVTKEYGIVFKECEDFAQGVVKVMNLNKKAI